MVIDSSYIHGSEMFIDRSYSVSSNMVIDSSDMVILRPRGLLVSSSYGIAQW